MVPVVSRIVCLCSAGSSVPRVNAKRPPATSGNLRLLRADRQIRYATRLSAFLCSLGNSPTPHRIVEHLATVNTVRLWLTASTRRRTRCKSLPKQRCVERMRPVQSLQHHICTATGCRRPSVRLLRMAAITSLSACSCVHAPRRRKSWCSRSHIPY